MLKSALFIGRKDLAFLLGRRETLIWVLVMPVVFFYFVGTVTGGFGSARGSADRPDPIALSAPADAGFIVEELARRLEQQRYRVERPATETEFAAQPRRLRVTTPDGAPSVTEAAISGTQVTVTFDRTGEGLAASFDDLRVARAVYQVVADLAAITSEGATPDPAAFARLAAMPRRLTLKVVPAGARVEPPTGFSQAVPGTLVMFTMLVLLTSGSILLVVEREQGLLRRLASAPISPGAIVLGKWIARMALGLVQIAVGMVIGTVLFDMHWGGSLGAVAVLFVGWAAFNASLAIVLGNVVRTQAQMSGLGVLTANVLAALGGCWWPIEITPAWMQSLALAIPTGWTMDAMHKLVNFGYGASAAVPHIVALILSAGVLGWVGARTFRYQ